MNGNTSESIVELHIPSDLHYQLIYRLETKERFDVQLSDEVKFFFCPSANGALCHSGALFRHFGMMGLVKSLVKLATPARMLYGVVDSEGELLHYGWVSVGKCNRFWIAANDVFIGPIRTVPIGRGRGLATDALKIAINNLVALGFSVFYGNAQYDNYASQRVMDKCGFGFPVSVYLKDPNES
jgi:hypothetical protein